jgi:hypothetical protein
MDDDFFEPDEDLAEVLRAFREGQKGLTARPSAIRVATAPTSYTNGSIESKSIALPAALPFTESAPVLS